MKPLFSELLRVVGFLQRYSQLLIGWLARSLSYLERYRCLNSPFVPAQDFFCQSSSLRRWWRLYALDDFAGN